MKYISTSTDQTEQIAFEISKHLKPKDIITLDGDLGAGKTAFVRGLARGLGIEDVISSPTFTIVNEYRKGVLPIFHFDVYRIESSEEMYDIGWEDYLRQDAVVVIEWAKIIEDILDDNIIKINITKDLSVGEDYREINIEGIAK